MTRHAQWLIEEAKQKRLTRLDLRRCGLTYIPAGVFELVWLEALYLCDTHYRWDEQMQAWQLIDSQNTGESNQISVLPEAFSRLSRLRVLDLSDNAIKHISAIACLTQMTTLSIRSNKIHDISAIQSLSQLTVLDLAGNQISELSAIAALKQLTCFDLSRNQISELSAIAALKQLTSFDISYNQISDISAIAALKQLTSFDLRSNQISDISAIAALSHVTRADLGYNPITSLAPLLPLIKTGVHVHAALHSKDITVGGCPLTHPPMNIVEQGNDAIIRYFQQLEEHGDTRLYEAKLIIVGEPGAGKTSMMEKLLDPTYPIPQDSDSTLGIQVREGWAFSHPDLADIEFRANFWDFGGQQIQYMTHQFFLTPSALYVLVSDNRAQHTNFPYWFNIIHLLGEEQGVHSPVLVVLNEKEHTSITNFDHRAYQKQYPELEISLIPLDLSKSDARLTTLTQTIQKKLTTLRHVGDKLPKQWKPIREDLRTLANSHHHINFARFQEICSSHHISEEGNQLLLSNYLHKLGSLLHFSQDEILRDFIILNPQWAVDAVYSVLVNTDIINAGGCFSKQQLAKIWANYKHIEQGHLLSLMQKDNFEICYRLADHQDRYIAPQLLADVKPNYAWDSHQSLKFRFQYTFMPEGIITRLIVRLNTWIAKDSGESLVWRKGMVINKDGCLAQVIEDENSRTGLKVIHIEITGATSEKPFLLRTVRAEIEAIHQKWFRNVNVDQMVPCCCEDCHTAPEPTYFEYSVLQQYEAEHELTIKCHHKKIKNVAIRALLAGVFVEEEQPMPAKSSRETTQPKPPKITDFKHLTQTQIQHIIKNVRIGIIPALPEEAAAVMATVDPANRFRYTMEREGAAKEYIVVRMPSERNQHWHYVAITQSGKGSAGPMIHAAKLQTDFPALKSLIVSGIAAGVSRPDKPDDDVRVGDIVVSGDGKGIVKFQTSAEGLMPGPEIFPSAMLSDCVNLIKTDEWLPDGDPLPTIIEETLTRLDKTLWQRPPADTDPHNAHTDSLIRASKNNQQPVVHRGRIANVPHVLKAAEQRQKLGEEHGVMAIDMEDWGSGMAALSDNIHFLSVRGISDNADENKKTVSARWRYYAALVAAAYVRQLIGSLAGTEE